jgi:transposase-like protein
VKAPATLSEFEQVFPSEESCWRHLRRMRWPGGFHCPRCRGTRSHRLGRPHLEQCASCRYQVSATAGTVFHGTRVPLRTWFWAIFFVARHKKSISALQFQRDAGLGSYKTAWLLLHKLRSTLSLRQDELLTGLVEVDESFVGGRKVPGPGGRGALHKTIVALAVEHRGEHAGRARLQVIPRVTHPEILAFLHSHIDPEAQIATDGLQVYRILPEAGFRHRRHIQGPRERAVQILPWVHRVAGNLKTWLRGTFHGVSGKHLQRYLDEFAFRLEHRWHEHTLFEHVLRRSTLASPFPYSHLVVEAAG